MYLRITERRNKDGSTVTYYALAENAWNSKAKRSEARVIHSFGRADRIDRDALQRLVQSINRVLEGGDTVPAGAGQLPEIERIYDWGVVLAARHLWEDLGIGDAIRRRARDAELEAPHEAALFAMAAQRLDQPGSKLACAERWLPEGTWLPEAAGLKVDQLYRALDFLMVWPDGVERGDRARCLPARRRPVPARCRPDLLRHHHSLL
jgi:hypothetical protein